MTSRDGFLWLAYVVGAASTLGAAAAFGLQAAAAAAFLALLVTITTIASASPQAVARLAYLTIALMFVDISPVTVGGSMVRLYQPLTITLIIAALAQARSFSPAMGPVFKWTVLFSALVATSLLWTISRGDTIALTLGQCYLLFAFVTFCLLLSEGHISVKGALGALWAGSFLSSIVAILQFALQFVGFHWGLFSAAGIPWLRPSGLMKEPDWTALAAAVGLIIVLAGRVNRERWYKLSVAVFAATIAVTAVRAVLIALATVIIASLASRHLAALRRPLWRLAGVAAAVGIIAGQVFPTGLSRLNLLGLLDSANDGGSVHSRLGMVDLILERGPDRPILGHGAGSLAYESTLTRNIERYAGGGELNAGRGSTNLFLTSFWDLGALGVVAVGILVVVWLRSAWAVRGQYPALLPLAILLLVDFQANNGIRFGFVWCLIAITSWASSHNLKLRTGTSIFAEPQAGIASRR